VRRARRRGCATGPRRPAGSQQHEHARSQKRPSDRGQPKDADAQRTGARVSVDDFGIGYSSLSCLRRLSVSTLKIDQSSVSHVDSSTDDTTILGAVVTMASALDLGVIAEGIERVEQRDRLLELGCGSGRGYLFGRAAPAEDVGARLRLDTRPRRATQSQRDPILCWRIGLLGDCRNQDRVQ